MLACSSGGPMSTHGSCNSTPFWMSSLARVFVDEEEGEGTEKDGVLHTEVTMQNSSTMSTKEEEDDSRAKTDTASDPEEGTAVSVSEELSMQEEVQDVQKETHDSKAKTDTASDPEEGTAVLVPKELSIQEVQDVPKETHSDDARPFARGRGEKAVLYIKYAYSGALLAFSIVTLAAAILTQQTTATALYDINSTLAFFIFWFLILYLALIEAGLNCMVGLKPVDPALYKDTHPLAWKCTQLTNKGDNLDRFIIGRQFLDYCSVFMTNLMVSSIKNVPLNVMGLPQGVSDIFLRGGLAVTLVTIVIGQLVSQMNAAHCKLDWINNWLMVGSTYAALAIEASGLLHASYLLQRVVGLIAGRPVEMGEGERGTFGKAWFWIRALGSSALLLFSLAATIKALFDGNTSMWPGVPAPVSILLLVALIVAMGSMDALQIAVYKVVHIPVEDLAKNPVALSNIRFALHGTNLRAFLMGRQIFQTVVLFVIAKIISIRVTDSDENIFGVSNGLQKFFNFGVLGAFLSTILASLSWRVLANSFPLAFLSNPFTLPSIRFCLFIESTGVCAVSWLIATANKKLLRLHPDETYIGKHAAIDEEDHCLDLSECLDVSECLDLSESTSDSSIQSDGI